MISRRHIVLGGIAASALICVPKLLESAMSRALALDQFEIVKPDEEWRRELTTEQSAVLRRHLTEGAGTSPLDKEISAWYLPLCRLRFAAVSLGHQVRQWDGLAELLGSNRGGSRNIGGPQLLLPRPH